MVTPHLLTDRLLRQLVKLGDLKMEHFGARSEKNKMRRGEQSFSTLLFFKYLLDLYRRQSNG
jgi:hypothetical protein